MVVTDKLYSGPGDEGGSLKGIRGFAADAPGHGGEKAVLGIYDFVARIAHQEGASAVSALCVAGSKAELAEERGLLIAQYAGDRDTIGKKAEPLRFAELAGRRPNLGERFYRHLKDIEHFLVPGQGFESHQHSAGSVGNI